MSKIILDLYGLIKVDPYLQPVREQCPLPEQKRRQAGPMYTENKNILLVIPKDVCVCALVKILIYITLNMNFIEQYVCSYSSYRCLWPTCSLLRCRTASSETELSLSEQHWAEV